MDNNFSSKHFKLVQVKEGIFAAEANEGGGAVGNAGFVDLGDKTLVFDTFNTQQASLDLKKIAEKLFDRPVEWVINSHWHGDHIRGNQTFVDRQIVSSKQTRELMEEHHPTRIKKQKQDVDGLQQYIASLKEKNDENLSSQIRFLSELANSLPTLELVLPQYSFDKEMTFYGSDRSAKLFTLGGGHSQCDAMLYLPDDKVIFTGDLLFVETHPTFFEESNPNEWKRILNDISQLEIDFAIPGHGPVGNREDLLRLEKYIEDILLIARQEQSSYPVPDTYKSWTSPEMYEKNIQLLKKKQENAIV